MSDHGPKKPPGKFSDENTDRHGSVPTPASTLVDEDDAPAKAKPAPEPFEPPTMVPRSSNPSLPAGASKSRLPQVPARPVSQTAVPAQPRTASQAAMPAQRASGTALPAQRTASSASIPKFKAPASQAALPQAQKKPGEPSSPKG